MKYFFPLLANPVPGNTVSTTPDPNNKIYLPDTLDDKANWEEVWKVANESKNASVGRSGDTDENVFDIIMGINAKERGAVLFHNWSLSLKVCLYSTI